MIALSNTHEIAACANLKLNQMRLLQAILAGLTPSRVVATDREIRDMMGDRSIQLDFSFEVLLAEGFIEVDSENRYLIPERFVEFKDSAGVGVVPMYQDKLRKFCRSDLKLVDLKLFYYLLGGLQVGNSIEDFSCAKVGPFINYGREATWRGRTRLINFGILNEGKNSWEISKLALGVIKAV